MEWFFKPFEPEGQVPVVSPIPPSQAIGTILSSALICPPLLTLPIYNIQPKLQ